MRDGKHVILCIDDDEDILEAMRMILEGAGYILETAPSAEAGLRKYKEVEPDLMIVDLMMEEVDAGTSLVTEVKALGAKVPLYLLSSVGDNLNLMADYSELGLAGILQKPVSPERLLSTLKAKLG